MQLRTRLCRHPVKLKTRTVIFQQRRMEPVSQVNKSFSCLFRFKSCLFLHSFVEEEATTFACEIVSFSNVQFFWEWGKWGGGGGGEGGRG